MRLFILSTFFVLGAQALPAQYINWAKRVESFSSEYGKLQYSASQAVGAPDVWPAVESSPVAWSPRWPDKGGEYIELSFGREIMAAQILIVQSFHPGAVEAVRLEDDAGNTRWIANDEAHRMSDPEAPLLRLRVSPAFLTVRVKLYLNTSKVQGYNHIDALGLSEREDDIYMELEESAWADGKDVRRLGPAVNSEYSEVHPLPGPGDSILFFTRKKHPDNYGKANLDDIWISRKRNGKWQAAVNAGAPANSPGYNHLNAFSAKSQRAWCAGNMNGSSGSDQLYTLTWLGNGFSLPEAVRLRNFYNVSPNTSFHVSADEKVMILSLQRNDSRKSKDLYVSFAGPDAVWSEPKNISSPVNTVADEVTPFIDSKGEYLYFASRGHSGYGDFDLYRSKRLDDSWLRWSEPVNLGPEINTAGWETYFSLSDDGQTAYFVRYVKGFESDIFEITSPAAESDTGEVSIRIRTVDGESGRPLEALIVVYVKGTTVGSIGNTFAFYTKLSELEKPLRIQASAEGYFTANSFWSEEMGNEITLALYPLREGVVVPIEHIFFEANSSKLKEASFPALNELAAFLLKHEGLVVEIAGHTNNRCSSSYCLKLSEGRARAVVSYLVSQGVPSGQLRHKGYGKEQPIDSNETEAGRKRNQRVEVRILEAGSGKN